MSLLVLCCGFAAITGAQQNLNQGLSVPASFFFNGKKFSLNWSSQPTPGYYKFEYLPAGDSIRNFTNLILLEHLTPGTANAAITGKIAELKRLQAGDKNVEYFSSVNSAGESELDFMVTAKGPGNTIAIAERNIYRYINSGKGLILLGFSTRRYGNDATIFLGNWKNDRTVLVKNFASLKVPELKRL